MRRLIFTALLLVGMTASAQTTYRQEGNKLVKIEQEKTTKQPEKTGVTVEIKGETFDVYKGSKGGFFVIRKSKKTGKEYRQYLKIEN